MFQSVLFFFKAVGVSILLWLLGEVLTPGMMLFPEGGRLDLLFDLVFFSNALKFLSVLYLCLELLGIFWWRDIINSILGFVLLAFAIYVVGNFFMI